MYLSVLLQVDAGIDAVGFEARGCGHASHTERPAQVSPLFVCVLSAVLCLRLVYNAWVYILAYFRTFHPLPSTYTPSYSYSLMHLTSSTRCSTT